MAASPAPTIDIEDLSLEGGAHILLKRALRRLPVGGRLEVRGSTPHLDLHLAAWCRQQGHGFAARSSGPDLDASGPPVVGWVIRGDAETARWRGAERAGLAVAGEPGAVRAHPKASWGVAARGALVEAGSLEFHFALSSKTEVWADDAARIYAQAAAAQWNPSTAIDWTAPVDLPEEVEDAVVQLMTYLIENENAALLIPARFLGQVHPHFREVVQVLAVQVADEARHVEVFTHRALLLRRTLGLSTAGGQASLLTLFAEPEFAIASFLLSVLGEGTFLNLLNFLHVYGPDSITSQVARLAAQDEGRHVAFGMAHLQSHLEHDPALRGRLVAAIERRHDALALTTGLNQDVFEALVLLAAGGWSPKAIAGGFAKVQALTADMAAGRQRRLERLGFTEREAERLSTLHTRNFM
jgi:hypothetical protein